MNRFKPLKSAVKPVHYSIPKRYQLKVPFDESVEMHKITIQDWCLVFLDKCLEFAENVVSDCISLVKTFCEFLSGTVPYAILFAVVVTCLVFLAKCAYNESTYFFESQWIELTQ